MTILYLSLLLLALLALAIGLAPLYQHAQHRRAASIIAVIFIAAAFSIYAFLGSPQIIPALDARQEKIKELRGSIVTNSELVKKDSNNLAAWVALGQDFVETGQLAAASNAFRHGVLLSGGDPKLLLAYAKALILDADGKVTDDAKKALDMVLVQDKQNPDARYFIALRNLQDGNTEEAMGQMKALYHSLPDDSPLKATINSQIGRN